MTYLPQDIFDIKVGRSTDAFNRLRVSNPVTLFDAILEYDELPFYWNTHTEGTASITHLSSESAVQLSVDATLNSRCVRQSKKYFRCSPGKGALIYLTGKFNPTIGTIQRLGYFDNNNGVFFEMNGTTLNVVKRDSSSGSVQEMRIPQNQWNLDQMNGLGKSGVTINPNNAQLFVIDFTWLGQGQCRFGFMVDGEIHYVHRIDNSNLLQGVWMATPHLPIRYEILNTGASSTVSMKQICSVVISESGVTDDVGVYFSAGLRDAPVQVGMRRPILSIRPKLMFKGKSNRIHISPALFSIYTSSNQPIMYELITWSKPVGAVWNDVHPESSVEFDTHATSISDGKIGRIGYVVGKSAETSQFLTKVAFTTNYDCTDSDVITLMATSLSSTCDVYANIEWKEVY